MGGKSKSTKQQKVDSQQVGIRQSLGLDYALKSDGSGNARQIKGTAESKRKLQRGPGGIIRIRGGDQINNLLKQGSINSYQAEGGDKYRGDCELLQSYGLGSASLDMKVDGGRHGGADIPSMVIDARGRVRSADRTLGPNKRFLLVSLCLEDMNIAQISRKTGMDRRVISFMLQEALDDAAVLYGIIRPKDRTAILKKIEEHAA